MSQDIFNDINPNVTSGTQLANDILNPFKDAVVSGFSGTSRPANLQAGGYWVDTTNDPTTWDLKLYDGTNDITLFQINLSSGTATVDTSGQTLSIINSLDDTSSPLLRFVKERLSGGQSLDGDDLGTIEITGTDNAGVERVHARMTFAATDDTSITTLGSVFTLEMADEASGTVAEIFRIEDQRFGYRVAVPQNTVHVKGDGIRSQDESDTTTPSKMLLHKKRLSGVGQVLNTDGIGKQEHLSTDDTGSIVEVASIQSSATVNHTTTDLGTKVVIQSTDNGSTTPEDKIVIENGTTTLTDNVTVEGDLTVSGTTTTVNSTTLDVTDANITVNNGGDQATADSNDAGVTVSMSDADNAIIHYDSTSSSNWKVGDINGTNDIATTDSAQVITNKDIDGGTASDTVRITVPKNDSATLDGLTRKEGTIVYDTDANKLKFDDGTNLNDIGSGGGFFNYIEGGDGSNVNSWVQYANTTASDRPDDFGGTASTAFTIASNTTTPLDDVNDILLTKDAANRQGEGVYYPFTIRRGDLSTILRLEAWAETSTNYADGDIGYYLVTSNDSFASDFNVLKIGDSGQLAYANARRLFLEGQTDATRTDARFCIHVQSTNALAYTINSQYSFGPRSIARGPIETDPVEYTPVFTSLGTVSDVKAFYKRSGNELEVNAVLTTGTVTASSARMSLPPGLSVDVDIVENTSGNGFYLAGEVIKNANADENIYVFVAEGTSTTEVFFGEMGGGSSGLTFVNANNVFANNEPITVKFKVPISGWSSNAKISEDFGNREIRVDARGNAGTACTAFVTNIDFTEVDDSTNSWDGTGFTAPETKDWLIVGATFTTASVSNSIVLYVNNNQTKRISGGYNSEIHNFSSIVRLNKGDVVNLRFSNNATLSNNTALHTLAINDIATPQTLLGQELTSARYTTTSGQSIADATTTQLNFETLDFDTHGSASSTSPWQVTLPSSGKFVFNCHIRGTWGSGGHDVGDFVSLYVYKNGSNFAMLETYEAEASPTSTIQISVSGSVIVNGIAGDVVDIRLQNANASGANNFLINVTSEVNYVEFYKIN